MATEDGRAARRPWRLASRLNSFAGAGGRGDVAGAIRAMARVPGIDCLELNYPQHLQSLAVDDLAALLAETGLTLTGLNLRFEGDDFASGAFTNPNPAVRARAIGVAREAVDFAARFGADHVVLWMADDGFDYSLQVDYARLWRDEIDGFRQVAAHDPAVRVSVEYKPNEPRRFALIRSMGEALLAVREVGLPTFGVTLDVCHALMAGEHPAAAAALALEARALFGVHLNDGYGRADDGLAVGTINLMTTFELLAALRRARYEGVIYFDTFPVREDPAAECATNVATVRWLEAALDRLDWDDLDDARARHDALAARRIAEAALRIGDG